MAQADRKVYVTPTVETLDSSEVVDLLGPVQGYGPGGGGSSSGALSMDPASTVGSGTVTFGR